MGPRGEQDRRLRIALQAIVAEAFQQHFGPRQQGRHLEPERRSGPVGWHGEGLGCVGTRKDPYQVLVAFHLNPERPHHRGGHVYVRT